MKNLLVAVDRPKDAVKLLEQAVRFAKLTGSKIWIIHVSEADPEGYLEREAGPQFKFDKLDKDREEAIDNISEKVETIKKEHNLEAEGHLIKGEVTKSIKNLVDQWNIDLVIAGHKRKNLVYGLFTENNKKDLINVLNIPLLAVPLG